ncbi:recombinase family protein [Aurantimonas coralicida]|uniref:recombinase family protein n=1 Tax=Aurantimonas coralicida TaxID=182270 RepID=UPI001E39D3AF|nr:recombinase family protein [Aurantimonas coralicida]MCD1642575.1 recombinase family protein [Aurantimonas coralicida]
MTAESENKPTRKVGYARVSTADQNPDMQIDALKKYGVPEDLIFVDRMSGASMKRPEFLKALTVAQHEGTEFVVWKLDRLGRTIRGIIDTMQLLDGRKVHLVSLTERFDLGTAFGRAILHFLAVFAELERDMIRERTMAGLKRAKERGGAHGRPRSMTPERAAKADAMLRDGHRGATVWREVKAMPGPGLSRAAYYAWQQLWDVENPAGDIEGSPE